MCHGSLLYRSCDRFEDDECRKGSHISFRDTSLDEIGYEVLRREKINGTAIGQFESVVLIDSSLSGCAATFSSLTFFDDESIKKLGSTYDYAIKTKYAEEYAIDLISDPFEYVTPWIGNIEGEMESGSSGIMLPNVRVCARFESPITGGHFNRSFR